MYSRCARAIVYLLFTTHSRQFPVVESPLAYSHMLLCLTPSIVKLLKCFTIRFRGVVFTEAVMRTTKTWQTKLWTKYRVVHQSGHDPEIRITWYTILCITWVHRCQTTKNLHCWDRPLSFISLSHNQSESATKFYNSFKTDVGGNVLTLT